jgi:glycosyltransferase 2 family protein
MHSHARRTALTLIKIALALGILGFLVFQARDAIANLTARTIDWKFMAAAMLCSLAAAGLGFVRWHILIRALDIGARLIDSVRLGALGFALNFVSPGSIGGDFFKAIFLAHGHPEQRPEAVASVVADRVMGLLTQLGLASCGILATGLLRASSPPLRLLCQTILVVAVAGWIGFIFVIFFGKSFGAVVRGPAEKIPLVGKTAGRLLATVDAYRGRKRMLLGAFGVSIVMALCFITTFYLVARGLPIRAPSWPEHLVIVPVASLVGAVLPTPNGLGTTEGTIEALYKAMPGGAGIATGDGTLVGLGRRLTDVVVALIGLGFYLSHSREMKEVFAEAEQIADAE